MSRQVNLLTNASATGSGMAWHGGPGTFVVVGTFSGATITLQYQEPQSGTWVAAGANSALTDVGIGAFDLAPGQIRALVAGSPSGIYATAIRNR